MIKQVLARLVEGVDLSEAEAIQVMETIMSGKAGPAQIGALLTALRMKGETIEEITGFARVMRARATPVRCRVQPLVDTCGTGGDARGTFNISTVAALVAAGAGVYVAKHGNRSASSSCGSADLLATLGVNIEAPPGVVGRCIEEIGIGFLFAPLLHSAMRYAVGPRREIGIRTVFNALGPLTNPAAATAQLLGVYHRALVERHAAVLQRLGSSRAYVVHSQDGLDEITTTGPTGVAELKDGTIRTYQVRPEDFALPRATLQDLQGGTPAENAAIALAILRGKKGPQRDIVLLNAAAAIAVAGLVPDIAAGIAPATESIDSGAALDKLEQLKRASQGR